MANRKNILRYEVVWELDDSNSSVWDILMGDHYGEWLGEAYTLEEAISLKEAEVDRLMPLRKDQPREEVSKEISIVPRPLNERGELEVDTRWSYELDGWLED